MTLLHDVLSAEASQTITMAVNGMLVNGMPVNGIAASHRLAGTDDNRANDPSAAADPVTVLVAVQAPRVREALTATIEDLEGFEVVAVASGEAEAISLARSLRPTLALVDEDLPGCCGTSMVQTLAQEHLVNAVVGIGLRGDGGRRARAAGAAAYVQTGAPPSDLVAALRAAALAALPVHTLLNG